MSKNVWSSWPETLVYRYLAESWPSLGLTSKFTLFAGGSTHGGMPSSKLGFVNRLGDGAQPEGVALGDAEVLELEDVVEDDVVELKDVVEDEVREDVGVEDDDDDDTLRIALLLDDDVRVETVTKVDDGDVTGSHLPNPCSQPGPQYALPLPRHSKH